MDLAFLIVQVNIILILKIFVNHAIHLALNVPGLLQKIALLALLLLLGGVVNAFLSVLKKLTIFLMFA
jgi:predicted neutral ceramidase superfamily lipid hydrolase